MAETLAQAQAKIKPKLEDFLVLNFDDELQQEVLVFLDYCKTKKISYPWSSLNTWALKSKGKRIGYIHIGDETDPLDWTVWLHLTELFQYDEFLIQENLQSIILNALKHCTGCIAYCAPGYTDKILGKEYCALCRAMLYVDKNNQCIQFNKPDAEAMEKLKRIIDFRLTLSHGTVNRPIFDSTANGLIRIDNKSLVSSVTDLQGNPIENKITVGSSIENLFDGKYKSYARFWANENSFDFVFCLNEPVELVMYSLVTSAQLQVPDSWKLYGTVSLNEPWILLDEQNEFPKPVTSYTERAFVIEMPAIYQNYRFVFKKCKFDLSQIHLYIK